MPANLKLTLSTAKYLRRLKHGESIAYSRIKNNMINELIAEGILWKKGNRQHTVHLHDDEALDTFLANQLQILDLESFIQASERENTKKADLTRITTDSKYTQTRAFKGFLVNSYEPLPAYLCGKPLTIYPHTGAFTFIYDYETFTIDSNVTLVGVENAENFRYIDLQKPLFQNITPLFISRYPQQQHKDFIRWASTITNQYWHFGDFDIAGIGIYLNEYKKYLGDRATFFIPQTIQNDLQQWGNRQRYNRQSYNFDKNTITENRLLDLLAFIEEQQKGLDQEFYIRK